MADVSDVQAALVSKAAQILYPDGTGQPSIAGVGVRIYAGWPVPAHLDTDLAAGVCHVSVFARAEERNTTRFFREWKQTSTPVHTITLGVAGQAVTVGGTIPTTGMVQNLAILANGKAYTYQATHADTLTTCATALSALAAVDIPGTANTGPVITFPAGTDIKAARVGGTAALGREIRLQERVFALIVWANTPAHRDAVANPLDCALADISFLYMLDGFAARLRYKSSPVDDGGQLERLYRRELWYSVEFATTQTDTATEVITITESINDITINV